MKKDIKIKIVGIGGQGVQFMGKLLSEAIFKQGLNVSMGVKYEPSTSGGLTLADVTMATNDQEIYYPFIETPDILITLAQRGWDDYRSEVSKNTIIISDEDNVQDFHDENTERAKMIIYLPFSRMAKDLGSEKLTNILVLGFLSEMLDVEAHHVPDLIGISNPEDSHETELLEVDPKYFEDSLTKSSPEKFRTMNIAAFKKGYDLALSTDYAKNKVTHLVPN